jgi:hypothetical protein
MMGRFRLEGVMDFKVFFSHDFFWRAGWGFVWRAWRGVDVDVEGCGVGYFIGFIK